MLNGYMHQYYACSAAPIGFWQWNLALCLFPPRHNAAFNNMQNRKQQDLKSSFSHPVCISCLNGWREHSWESLQSCFLNAFLDGIKSFLYFGIYTNLLGIDSIPILYQ